MLPSQHLHANSALQRLVQIGAPALSGVLHRGGASERLPIISLASPASSLARLPPPTPQEIAGGRRFHLVRLPPLVLSQGIQTCRKPFISNGSCTCLATTA